MREPEKKSSDPSEFLKDPHLRPSIYDGMAQAVMAGSGETYFNPYGIFLKASSLQIGLLTSLPQLIGALFQSMSVWLMERFPSRRRIILTGVCIQSGIWIPIILIPYIFGFGTTAATALIALVALYHIVYQVTVPAWNSLIGDLVPIETRGSFFGFRNRRTGLLTFLSLTIAGQLLHIFEKINLTVAGFTIIFFIAFVARAVSASWLARYPDPPYHIEHTHKFSFWQFIRRAPSSNFAKFVFFVASMNFAAYISAPYFALYMLEDLQMSYLRYTLVIAAATVTQFMTMHYWGVLSDRFGNRIILTVCGAGIAVTPFLWMIWSSTIAIIFLQAFGGFMWAGFNLAAGNFMFDAVSPPKRARCVAYQSLINSSFVLAGSVLGGYLAQVIPSDWPISHGVWTPESPFIRIFFLSGMLRFLVVFAFLRLFIEVRQVEHIRHRDLIFRITNLRPISGATFALITGALRRNRKR